MPNLDLVFGLWILLLRSTLGVCFCDIRPAQRRIADCQVPNAEFGLGFRSLDFAFALDIGRLLL
jgi:hypothetical protein